MTKAKNNNKLFDVYTNAERIEIERTFERERAKIEPVITEVVEVRVVKKPWGYVGYEDNGTMNPLGRVKEELKARQRYRLYLNDYQRVVKYERI